MNVDLRTVRVALVVVLVVLLLPLAGDLVAPAPAGTNTGTGTGTVTETGTADATGTGAGDTGRPTGNVAYVVDAQGPGQLTVVNRSRGEQLFSTDEYDLYHDVDPSPRGDQTLMYVASNIRGEAFCPDRLESPCAQDVIEVVNYSTGETERLWSRFVAYNGSSNIHDVDRVSGSEYIIADIQYDEVSIVDVTTNETVWTWQVSEEFDRSSGGRPDDWTHVNDVEVVREDLYMVNLRNQDQVVFVHRQRGLQENMTIGADDDHETLYEQHNADYIPADRGGPAVIVADSENNRVVEFQRTADGWEETWVWTDERMQWPRDADRLPNNNTLVTDTHGTRLLELTPNGTIVWSYTVPRGVYEAELLGTGDESAGGASMARIRGEDEPADVSSVSGAERAQKAFLSLFPPLVLHGFLYVLPTWISPLSGAFLLIATLLAVLWGLAEAGLYTRSWLRSRA